MIISAEDVLELSGVETLHPGGLELSRRIGELVRFNSSTRLLDVSSGKGAFACLFAREFGSRVTGIDVNARFVERAKQRALAEGVAGKVDFRIGDSRRLPFAADTFDVVVNECAVGLTAIADPQSVLTEMVRVTKPGGTVVIHENTLRRELPAEERRELSLRIGTTPYAVEEWKQMLLQAGATPGVVEDWSGLENVVKMRPDRRWSAESPLDIFTAREKLFMIPALIRSYGAGPVLRLAASARKLSRYFLEGYLGYVLIVSSKS